MIGTTKGKGFAGTVKRWNLATQDATHGNSLAHRKPGSIGQCQTPGRVWKGKKMSGHMGNVRQTTQNLKVQKIDLENNFILINIKFVCSTYNLGYSVYCICNCCWKFMFGG